MYLGRCLLQWPGASGWAGPRIQQLYTWSGVFCGGPVRAVGLAPAIYSFSAASSRPLKIVDLAVVASLLPLLYKVISEQKYTKFRTRIGSSMHEIRSSLFQVKIVIKTL